MKTAEAKVDELMSNWITEAQTLAQLERQMVQLLKEQDRDTRHACAGAIAEMDGRVHDVGSMKRCVDKDAAHSACMNVKAV